jgi:hypothetical protein
MSVRRAAADRGRPACLASLVLALLALGGCETTAEKSAKLEAAAKRVTLAQEKGLSISRPSATVQVVGAAIVRDSERAAAIVTLHNRSATTQRAVPIAITVRSARGATVFQNNSPGLESALVSVPSIAAHATVVWVDDQLPVSGSPASVSAVVGEAPSITAPSPTLAVTGARITEDPANGVVATGTVTNRSKVAQASLVVFAVARRGGAIVGAGRAIVSQLSPGAASPFQASLVGHPLGARVAIFAPAADLQ